MTEERLEDRLREIERRVANAAERAGRDPAEITIVGVSKTKPADAIRDAAAAGLHDAGENYVQELVTKHEELGDLVRWHFIGHLQRNKVKYVAPFVHMIHAVDSERLGEEIDRRAGENERRIPVLLQVNTSGEESKFGCDPDAAPELGDRLASLPNVDLVGLMTLAAWLDDPEGTRPMFRLLGRVRDDLRGRLGLPLPHLSMGMTNDFEVAIEEGATLVRIGTAIYGER